LAHWNCFFNDHKTVTYHNFQNLISRKLSNVHIFSLEAIVSNASSQEVLIIFLPTDASFRNLGRVIEVVFLNDSAVGSGQPTEIKTKNLGNMGLNIENDLRDFDKENSSRRMSEGWSNDAQTTTRIIGKEKHCF
jgi:hypothetical protein